MEVRDLRREFQEEFYLIPVVAAVLMGLAL